ncbi:MAG: hypothetical protein GYA50_10645 [Eubacteriaceae bacterium]|nr:hypothetical protein [Eubacteriaceae bacterium]
MKNNTALTKILAITGTVIVLAPFAFMIITSIIGSIRMGMFRMDYLIPAEMVPLVLLGALMIFWAALLSKNYLKLIISTMAAAMVFFIGCMVTAAASGLASGATEPKGTVWVVVIAMIILYSLSAAGIGIQGIMVIRKLFRKE